MTLWSVTRQAPLSMEFFRQECWSKLPFPSSGNFPNPGIKPRSLASQAVSFPSEPPGMHAKSLQPCLTPLSMGFSRQEYWSGLPFSSPGDPPNPGIKPGSLALQADSLLSELPGKPILVLYPISNKWNYQRLEEKRERKEKGQTWLLIMLKIFMPLFSNAAALWGSN